MPRKTPLFGMNLFYHDEPIISTEDIRPGTEYSGEVQPDAQNTLNYNFKRMDFILQSILDGTLSFNEFRTLEDVNAGRDVVVGRNLIIGGRMELPRTDVPNPHTLLDFGDALVHAGKSRRSLVLTKAGVQITDNTELAPFTPDNTSLPVVSEYPVAATISVTDQLVDTSISDTAKLLVAFDQVPQNLSSIQVEFSTDGGVTYPLKVTYQDEKATANTSFYSDPITLQGSPTHAKVTLEGTNDAVVNFNIRRIALIAEGTPPLEEFYLSTAGGDMYGHIHLKGDATITGLENSGVAVPNGGIIMWSGSETDIPNGWLLCDGLNGTPDLRDRFVVGASATKAAHTTGGATSKTSSSDGAHAHTVDSGGAHTHSVTVDSHTLSTSQMPSHTHGIKSGDQTSGTSSNRNAAGTNHSGRATYAAGGSGGHAHTASSGSAGGHAHTMQSAGAHTHTVDVTPPYYALCFIMKG